MSARRKSLHDEPLSPLGVGAGVEGDTLRACVTRALERYLATLDGHDCTDLFRLVVAVVEAPMLECVLRYTQGNQSRAAEMLGINRATLRKKCRLYGIE